jgi:hypothetical protein
MEAKARPVTGGWNESKSRLFRRSRLVGELEAIAGEDIGKESEG